MGIYVVGDIHGCFEAWMTLKDKIEQQDRNAKFILVGDIVDRGPDVYKMICWARENVTQHGRYQMIMGNHEEEKIRWFQQYKLEKREMLARDPEQGILMNYRKYKPDRYDFQYVMEKENLDDSQVQAIITWFQNLPPYKEIWVNSPEGKRQHYVIVHGGYPRECRSKNESFRSKSIYPEYRGTRGGRFNPKKRNLLSIIWNRNYEGYPELSRTTVVHGHTPTIDDSLTDIGAIPGKIHHQLNDINVDCGCVFPDESPYYNLAAIRLEDQKEFYYR